MRSIAIFLTGLSAIEITEAFPGMGNTMEAISSIAKRQISPPVGELLADLKTLPESELTPAGTAIKNILLINRTAASPQDFTTVYKAPGPLDSSECRAETCCLWKYIADELTEAFRGESGRCNDLARGAVRLGFHDAGTWSRAGGGGADGSVVLAGEVIRPINRGLEEIVEEMESWYAKWHPLGAGMADLIQVAATVAAVVCPLGPRVRLFVGRNDSSVPAPESRLPEETQDMDSLVALFNDKTIIPGELVSLLGAHTVSQQRFVDPLRAGDPQDSTPGVWDVNFYTETLSDNAPPRVLKFHSDVEMSKYPESKDIWGLFMDPVGGQAAWGAGYAGAYVRLSVLGVPHINNLMECTGVLPLRITNFTAPDKVEVDKFLATEAGQMGEEAVKLLEGKVLES